MGKLSTGPLAAIQLALVLGAGGFIHRVAADEALQTAWGDPDLGGLWDFRTLTPMERPAVFGEKAVLTPEEAQAFQETLAAARIVDQRVKDNAAIDLEGSYNDVWYDWGQALNEDLRTSLIVDPPNGRLPELTPAAKARLQEQNKRRSPPVRDMFSFSADVSIFRPAGPESLGLSERCLVGFNAGPPLTPSAYNNNLRIVQTPEHVLMVTEMIHNARVVAIDGRPHLPRHIRQWSGDARGWWDEQTLVVETTNFTDKTPTLQLPADLSDPAESGAVGSGEHVRLIERFTRTADDRLLYEYTVEDLRTFTQSFSVAIPMKAATGKMFEYACHEGNYAIGGMLRGARILEAESNGTGG